METKQLQALVGFGLSGLELVFGLANGLGFDDLKKALEVAKRATSLKDAKQAFEQYRLMTDAQAAELEAYVVNEFDIPDDKIEQVVEGALSFLIHLHEMADLLPWGQVVRAVPLNAAKKDA